MGKLRVGNKVKVVDGSGILSGKEGYLIAKKDIPMKEDGVPNLPGHYNILQPREVGVKELDNSIFVVYMNKLEKLSED